MAAALMAAEYRCLIAACLSLLAACTLPESPMSESPPPESLMPEPTMAEPEQMIHRKPLSYELRLGERDAGAIDLVVIHCTELPDLGMARKYGERIKYQQSKTGNSGHFYVTRFGRVEQWVQPGRVAHHTAGFNERSIGIELVNRGRYPNWFHSEHQVPQEPYTEVQIEALIRLLRSLKSQYPGIRYIAGHEDLDTRKIPAEDRPEQLISRKIDPGPKFPWQQVLNAVALEPWSDHR